MSPTLADLLAWNPSPLSTQAMTLQRSSEEARNAFNTLGGVLDILPQMWTGVAADATRDALTNERRYLDAFANAVAALSEVYSTAYTEVDSALSELRYSVDAAHTESIDVDTSSPAAGPISVRTTADVSNTDLTSRLRAAADVIAAAAAVVLDADNSAATRINDAVTDLHNTVVAEASNAHLQQLLETHSLNAQRYGDIPVLNDHQDQAVRDLFGSIFGDTGTRAMAIADSVSNVRENRVSVGDGIFDVLTKMNPIPRFPPQLGTALTITEFLAPDIAENFDFMEHVVDGSLRPLTRWAEDHVPGSRLFVNDDELDEKLQRDLGHG